MSKKFKQLIENIDVLSEDAKSSIQEAFDMAVSTKVEERLQLEVNKALSDIDSKHAVQLEKVLSAVDTDHAQKFQSALKKIDEDHTTKLKNVVRHYERALKNDSKVLREELEEDLSNFLDLYIEKIVPTTEIKKAVENTNAKRIVESIKQLVSIDEDYINDNIKEALKDGKQKMDTLHSKLNTTLKENIDLKRSLSKQKTKTVLERKTEDMPVAKKSFINKFLGDRSPEYIEENFNYVVEMFDRDDDESAGMITESTKRMRKVRKPISESVDTPVVVKETKARPNTVMDEYLSGLNE